MVTKVYTGELIPGARPFPILNRHFGVPPYAGKKPYRAIFDAMDFGFIELTQKPEEAEFFLLPHSYSAKILPLADKLLSLARKYGKPSIFFAYGDKEEQVLSDEAIVFRYFGYRHREKRKNEIIMPTQVYARDILGDGLFYLRKKEEVPTVSFCGWAGFNSVRQRLGHFFKTLPLDIRKYLFFDTYADVYKQGIYFRKKSIRALEHSPLVKTSFLIRNFYTANKYTVEGDPGELRKEYIGNMRHSDFVLVARGDANMAVRFYETLALGRIPVVIDTNWVLPLEDVIDYKKFVVFVPYTDIKNTDRYIRKFWDAKTESEFQSAQKLARETFMKYLKFDSFLKYAFEKVLPERIHKQK